MAVNDLSVGEFAARAGVAVSTIHYYEAEGLIESWRTAANHRRYDRRQLRRVAIARVAQGAGISLGDVKAFLGQLPKERAVRKSDWAEAGAAWAEMLDARIDALRQLRHQMDYCIGCGCLSLENCPLYNEGDKLGQNGSGARRWVGKLDERAPIED